MVREALRGYLSLAGGITEVTAAKARAAARSLVEQGEATAGQVSALAEDLVSTSRRNRESLVLIIRHEAEQAVRRLGLGAAADVETLTQRIRRLEQTVRELRTEAARAGSSDGESASSGGAASSTASKRASGKKTAKRPAAKKSAGKRTSTARKTTKAATRKTSARKTGSARKTTKAATRKPSARKSAAKRTTSRRSSR